MKSIHEKLRYIQTNLVVTKGRRNPKGFTYRNLEDIMIAIKPLLEKTKTVLTLSDKMVVVDEDTVIQATATLSDESGSISCSSYGAIEPFGDQNLSQAIGAGSSYARKYAAGGLLLLDDNQDADSNGVEREPVEQEEAPPTRKNTKAKKQSPPKETETQSSPDNSNDSTEEASVEPMAETDFAKVLAWVKKNKAKAEQVREVISGKYSSSLSVDQASQIEAVLISE